MTTRAANAALAAIAVVVLLTPLFLSPQPMLGDYPNHLARFWLLSGGVDRMADVYGVDWSRARTNIATDLLAYGLRGLVPAEVIGRGVLAAAIVTPPLGLWLLNNRLHGPNVWQLAFPGLAWLYTLIFGFVQFEIGLGAALLAAALDAALRPSPAKWGLRLAIAVAMLVIHPFALLFYAGLLGGLIIGPDVRRLLERRELTTFVGRGVGLVVCCALPVGLLMLTSRALPGTEAKSAEILTVWNPSIVGRVAALASPVFIYETVTDIAFIAALAVVPALAVVSRRFSLHHGLFVVAVVLAGVSLLMPMSLAGTSAIEARLPPMALLAAAASFRVRFERRELSLAAALFLALVSLARTADVTRHWLRNARDVESLRTVLDALPTGARLVTLQHKPREDQLRAAPLGRYFSRTIPAFSNAFAYAVPWRQAFVPLLFTATGKQPLTVAPAYQAISMPEGDIPSVAMLADPNLPGPPSQAYARQWRRDFDYALILNTDMPDENGPVALPSDVRVVANDGFATLLRLPRAAAISP